MPAIDRRAPLSGTRVAATTTRPNERTNERGYEGMPALYPRIQLIGRLANAHEHPLRPVLALSSRPIDLHSIARSTGQGGTGTTTSWLERWSKRGAYYPLLVETEVGFGSQGESKKELHRVYYLLRDELLSAARFGTEAGSARSNPSTSLPWAPGMQALEHGTRVHVLGRLVGDPWRPWCKVILASSVRIPALGGSESHAIRSAQAEEELIASGSFEELDDMFDPADSDEGDRGVGDEQTWDPIEGKPERRGDSQGVGGTGGM